MKPKAAIIAGTGIAERLSQLPGKKICVPNAFGLLEGRLVELGAKPLLIVSRHSSGHKTPPHLVNYRAIAAGLKALSVQFCFASAAVGTLRQSWQPGQLCVCSEFWDVSGRKLTLFDQSVRHTDVSNFENEARNALLRSGGSEVYDGGIYACSPGPRYETSHEVKVLLELGADLVGMTASSEAILMQEAGIPYACLATVTNFAAGIATTPLSHEEVVRQMHVSAERATQILLDAARSLA
jgi:5'-methylthioadenosine phosphorylase